MERDIPENVLSCMQIQKKEANKLASMLEARFPNLKGNVEVKDIGHVNGAHTGPGTVAVFFCR